MYYGNSSTFLCINTSPACIGICMFSLNYVWMVYYLTQTERGVRERGNYRYQGFRPHVNGSENG